MIEMFTWFGILFCITQSAMFSGLNLALFSLNRLDLEVEVASGNRAAEKVLKLRQNSNFALTTILWGNVSINVLLTLLSDSVLLGASAFLFSTFFITIFGEIVPQAYFSRNALKMASLLAPVFRFYQLLLYPVAKPSGLFLDRWLGLESIQFYREQHLKEIIRRHMRAEDSEVDRIEAMGALNFLTIDDMPIMQEGVPLDPDSIIELPFELGKPVFPVFGDSKKDPFLIQVEASGKPWVVITDQQHEPKLLLDADGFLRDALFRSQQTCALDYCHDPAIVTDSNESIGEVVMKLQFDTSVKQDDVISQDVILLWDDHPRVITGADLFARLMRGILQQSTSRLSPADMSSKQV